MKQTNATLLGMAAASVFAAGVFAVLAPMSGTRDVLSIAGTFVVAYFFVACALALLATPMFVVLNKRNLVRWWSAVCAGAVTGAIAFVAVTASVHVELEAVLKFSVLGGAAGLVFWLFWRLGER